MIRLVFVTAMLATPSDPFTQKLAIPDDDVKVVQQIMSKSFGARSRCMAHCASPFCSETPFVTFLDLDVLDSPSFFLTSRHEEHPNRRRLCSCNQPKCCYKNAGSCRSLLPTSVDSCRYLCLQTSRVEIGKVLADGVRLQLLGNDGTRK